MPYIKAEDRPQFDTALSAVKPESAGELNYVITRILWRWYAKQPGYLNICIVIGTLVCAALEFYRRVAAPYENVKLATAGDVYTREE
jgi:hypothetical protein